MQFGDLRGWIAHLEKEGELHEINTEVDWDCELGTVTRRAFGNGDAFEADIQPRAELLLYFASRAQNVDQVIRPGLDSGRIVLCDRFTDSTLVYQGSGRGIDTNVVLELDRIACRGLKPDVTFLIDIDLETSLARAKRRNDRVGQSESRIDEEGVAFHERVRQGYLALAGSEPDRFVVIDGRGAIGEVGALIREAALEALQERV